VIALGEGIYADERVLAMDFEKFPMPSPYAPRPFLLFDNLIEPQACQEALKSLPGEAQRAALRGKEGINPDIRDTLLHPLTPQIRTLYDRAERVARDEIERFFGVALTTATAPQLLEYGVGGHYRRHADNAGELVDKEGRLVGYRPSAPGRKVTTLLFLSTYGEDFEGGELLFNHLYDREGRVLTLYPKAGTMVVFASHGLFAHEVRPVTRGRRFAIARWHDAMR